MKNRTLLALFCVPLCAFTCVSTSSLVVRPQIPTAFSPSAQAIEVLTQEFETVLLDVSDWATQNNYEKQECSTGTTTPLCKRFSSNRVELTVKVDPQTNNVDLLIADWSGGDYISATKRNLIQNLTKSNKWSVKDKYAH
jgi:hypothetical protein